VTSVFDAGSAELVHILSEFNRDRHAAGRPIAGATAFLVGVASDPDAKILTARWSRWKACGERRARDLDPIRLPGGRSGASRGEAWRRGLASAHGARSAADRAAGEVPPQRGTGTVHTEGVRERLTSLSRPATPRSTGLSWPKNCSWRRDRSSTDCTSRRRRRLRDSPSA
jgi:hypothetical protein